MAPNSNESRILSHLKTTKPQDFTAADIAKDLNLTARMVAGLLKDTPGVEIISRRRYAHTESGNHYRFVECVSL